MLYAVLYAVGPTEFSNLLVQPVDTGFYVGVKAAGTSSHLYLQSSSRYKNVSDDTSTTSYAFALMCLIKHRDNVVWSGCSRRGTGVGRTRVLDTWRTPGCFAGVVSASSCYRAEFHTVCLSGYLSIYLSIVPVAGSFLRS